MIPIHGFTDSSQGAFIAGDLPTLAFFQRRQQQSAVCRLQQGSRCAVYGQFLCCQSYRGIHGDVSRQHLINRQGSTAVDAYAARGKHAIHCIRALHRYRHGFIRNQQRLICLHGHVIQHQTHTGDSYLHLRSCIQCALQAVHASLGDFRHLSAREVNHRAPLIGCFSGHRQGSIHHISLPGHAFTGILQPQIEAAIVICPVSRVGISLHGYRRYALSGTGQHAPAVRFGCIRLHAAAGNR